MGFMQDGQWQTGDAGRAGPGFERAPTTFRDWITPGGRFEPEPGRYHLYVSLACPWASRAVVVRTLKKLEHVVPMTVVNPDMLENGWTFDGTRDPVNGFAYVYELYRAADPHFSGRATVPVLWDRKTGTIVNNESAEIIVMLDRAFNEWADRSVELYPQALEAEIDALNERTYARLNNAVYRAGFSTSQDRYEAAVRDVFSMLDELEQRLAAQRYLVGRRITLADVRVFTSGVRFDLVYHGHFKCNLRRWQDYPNLWGWLRDIYQTDGVAETVDAQQIKRHYYGSQRWVNPSGVIALGPEIDFGAPCRRGAATPSTRPHRPASAS